MQKIAEKKSESVFKLRNAIWPFMLFAMFTSFIKNNNKIKVTKNTAKSRKLSIILGGFS